jgi:glucose-1-phosphate thymidylyltransferase
MKSKGLKFAPGKVNEWLDCGNKNATVSTHARWLELNPKTNTIGENIEQENSVIIQPCYIGKNVKISGSVIGPHVSISDGTEIHNSVVVNSIVQKNTRIQNSVIGNSMIGSSAHIHLKKLEFSLGDFSVLNQE